MSGLSAGDRVDTRLFGPGVLKRVEGRTARVWVDKFEMEIEIPLKDLTQIVEYSKGRNSQRLGGGDASGESEPLKSGAQSPSASRPEDWAPSVGSRVLTPTLGPGVLVEISGSVGVVRLGSGAGMRVREHLSALRPVSSTDNARMTKRKEPRTQSSGPSREDPQTGRTSVGKPRRAPRPTPALGSRESLRQTVEALRFGLVPAERLSELTIGYSALRDWTLSRLPHTHAGEPQASEISGPFGTGKSHAAAVVRQVAREENYLTAHVEVDGRNVTMADPRSFLGVLWSNLVIPGQSSATPVLDVYLKAMERKSRRPMVVPKGIDRVGDNFSILLRLKGRGLLDAHAEGLEAVLSSSGEFTASEVVRQISRDTGLSANLVPLRPMIGLRVDDRPYDFIESIAGVAALGKQGGFRGLVVTIDEMEVEWALLPPEGFRRALALLRVLGEYLQGNTLHRHVPLAVFISTVGQEGEAGDPFVTPLLRGYPGERHPVNPLTREDRNQLAQKIHKLYCDAYKVHSVYDSGQIEEVEADLGRHGFGSGEVVREFVKLYTSTLDSLYGPPHGSLPT